jgi:hypothetical protein
MRINTLKSIALGERIHKQYGSWSKALQGAELRDGIYVLNKPLDESPSPDTSSPGAWNGQSRTMLRSHKCNSI